MSKIKNIIATEILNSNGTPAIEAIVTLSDGTSARASSPSGLTHEVYEAAEVRDQDEARYNGMGMKNAIKNVEEIILPGLSGIEVYEQQKIDKTLNELDGTQNKSKLGASVIFAVSKAVMKAGAKSAILPLPLYIRQFVSGDISKKIPTPIFDIIEGHLTKGSGLSFQEFLIIPASTKTYSESLTLGAGVYSSLKKILEEKNLNTLVSDRGGFSPELSTNHEALSIIREAIERANYSFSLDVFLGVDAGANKFADGKTYKMGDRSSTYNSSELVEYYRSLVTDSSVIYIEDPFAADDWDGWKKVFASLSEKATLSGGDLIATNPYRLQLALENKVVNAITVKPNQIGTVSEAIAVVEIARFKGLKVVVSDRSVETMDPFIADFGVGVGADYVKFGAPVRERVVKYNQLLKIEKELKELS